jgi:hypothetical protein
LNAATAARIADTCSTMAVSDLNSPRQRSM